MNEVQNNSISKVSNVGLDKMRVIYLRKHAWIILLAIGVFVGGNIVLFYKFLGRATLEQKRLRFRNIAKDIMLKEMRARPSSHLALLATLESSEDSNQTEIRPIESALGIKTNDKGLTRSTSLILIPLKNIPSETHVNSQHTVKPSLTEKLAPTTSTVRIPDQIVDDTIASRVGKRDYKIAVLVIACNRPSVKRCLDLLLKYRPSAEKFPIIVSQDCGHSETAVAIKSYGDQLTHIEQPNLSDVVGVPPGMYRFMGYYKISRHFKFALGKVFDDMKYDTVVIVEDDLDIAPDFFEYFQATRPLLNKDPTLWCVSAWNDNGKDGMVQGNDLLFRTDFFPGLGWMLTKQLWNELKPKWPLGFWDDWMREPAQRKNRACIRPDISRTRTFGKIGVSQGQFYEQHLKFIKLNDRSFPFTQTDLSYLIKETYDAAFSREMYRAPLVTISKLSSGSFHEHVARVEYSSKQEYVRCAKAIGAMADFKAGIARAAYKGVVTVMFRGIRVYLAPTNYY